MNRRDFLKSAAALSAGVIAGCSMAPAYSKPKKESVGFFVDKLQPEKEMENWYDGTEWVEIESVFEFPEFVSYDGEVYRRLS